MRKRTSKPERRRARRELGRYCRLWGTGRVARLIRSGAQPHQLQMAEMMAVPPELLVGAGPDANHWSGQYWPLTGEVFDAPYHPRQPGWLAVALGRLMDDLNRDLLRPKLEQMGANPTGYTVAYTIIDDQLDFYSVPGEPLPYVPPEPTITDWTWEPPSLEDA